MKTEHQADKLVDIYLNGLLSISNDAGWEGENIMALMIAFHGQIPWGGPDQADVTMIHAIEKLRDKHHDFRRISKIVESMLKTCGETNKILSLLSKRYYVGLNTQTGMAYNDYDRLRLIGHAPTISSPEQAKGAWESALRNYRKRAQSARQLLNQRFYATSRPLDKCTVNA